METLDIQKETENIRKDPYNYVCDWVESMYPFTGKKVFQILSLMPVSLIIPDLTFMSKSIRSNINCLFLASSGAGKSSLSKQFSNFTYNPFEVESITAAKLENKLKSMKNFSLIVGDFARLSKDPAIVKIIEGILGEEKKLNRETMREEINSQTNGVGLLCGTPQDLSEYLTGGLIFRIVPLIIFHDADEHSAVGKHIMENVGEDNFTLHRDKEKIIQDYYKELVNIQEGKNSSIAQVTGYTIDDDFRKKAYESWNKFTRPIVAENALNFFRELQEFFRFLIAHAFFNVYNRKIVNGKLHCTQEDFEVALKLMKRTIEVKYKLLRTERFARSLRTVQDLDFVMKSRNIPEEDKNILKNIIKPRNIKY